MHYYQLDNKELDALFLAGAPVFCKAAIRKEDCVKLREGTSLVVMLSNGKKYKARIIQFLYQLRSDYAEGELKIVRAR